MFPPYYNLAMLAAEAQQAFWLRVFRIAGGGRGAAIETNMMVPEKMEAATRATLRLMTGASPDSVVGDYRRKVRANIRRLSKVR